MRIQSWLLLALSMTCGTAFAFLVGLVWFPLKPVVVQKEVPKTQIIVAKKDIPVGTVLGADVLQFDFVPNEKIPVGATNDFFRLYSRKTLSPIAQGTPICDLDLDGTASGQSDGKGKIPFGMSLVRIQIDRVQGTPLGGVASRLEGTDFSADSLSASVKPNDLVDLMVLETSQKFSASASGKKPDSQEAVYVKKPSRLVVPGIRIHSTVEVPRRKNVSPKESVNQIEYPSIALLMSQEQLNLAKAAAKEGRLQIQTHLPFEPIAKQPLVPQIEKIIPESSLTKISVPPLPKSEPFQETAKDVNTDFNVNEDKGSEAVALARPFRQQPGEIVPVNGTTVVSITTAKTPKSTGRVVAPQQRTAENRDTVITQPKPQPKVIEIGMGAFRKTSSFKVRTNGTASTQTAFVEKSTEKSSGQPRPAVEVYSFAPKNRKKTDLFPKYFYGITELTQETSSVAVL